MTASGLTSEQFAALATREVSVALAAGAGCGKTFVLTERFLSHLDPAFEGQTQPARLPELVAITFTERAAREMRDRIRRKCHERVLAAATDEQSQHWLALLRELDAARVSTIHSFCGSLLRAHAVEAGLDPRFRVLEESQSATMLSELVDDQLRRQLSQREPAAMDLTVRLGLESLRRRLFELLRRAREEDYETWLARTPDDVLQAWTVYYREQAFPALMKQFVACAEARALVTFLKNHHPTHAGMRDRRALLLELLSRLPQSTSPSVDLREIRELAKVGNRRARDWPSQAVYEVFRDTAEALRDRIDKQKDLLEFDPDEARPAAEFGLKLLQVAHPIAQAYAHEKRELGCLDFDDLLIAARRLLCDPKHDRVRRRAAEQIRLLLVDEFQDTDPLQVELVEALCDHDVAGGKLFFVGDYKQSIYRFRGADPQVFRGLSGRVPEPGRLQLTRNFRSQPAVLAFVNALFCDVIESYAPLVAHRPQIGPTPCVEFLWAPSALDGSDERDEAASLPPGEKKSSQSRGGSNDKQPTKETADEIRRREAHWIARRLRQLLDSRAAIVWDQSAETDQPPRTRPLEPGDIALLFRALSDVQLYEEALRDHGIDYYLVGGHAFYAQQEVFDLLNLLRAIDSACDEVSLAGTLRSPLFSLADETLFWLVQHKGSLAAGLFAAEPPPQLAADECRRVSHAAATLRELRAKKNRVPIADLINEALARTGYDAVLAAEFLGERKLANLRKLIDDARTFDRSAMFTLADFITQVAEFVAEQPKEPLAATHPESTNVVRLMTIHAAKGLEFPLVVVPDLARRPHSGALPAQLHRELGPLVKLPKEHGSETGTCGLDLLGQVEAVEEEQERLRLLYVATTRAADYLILSSGLEDPHAEKFASSWMGLVAERFDLASGALRAKLPAGYALPEVRVTATEPALLQPVVPHRDVRRIQQALERANRMAFAEDVPLPPCAFPVPVDAGARRHFSFSRLHGTLKLKPQEGEEESNPVASGRLWIADLPAQAAAIASSAALNPLELGTLVHAVLEEIPFGPLSSTGGSFGTAEVAALVERHAPQHLRNPQASPQEAIEMIARFLTSPRAAALAQAQRRHVELEFMLAWPLGHAGEGCRYLEGVIDCLYQDLAGDWHILDYKTNHVAADTLAQVVAGYEMQMLVYALAAERVLHIAPKSMVLHFLRVGLEAEFRLDDRARQRAMELVDASIAEFIGARTQAATTKKRAPQKRAKRASGAAARPT